MNVIMFRTTNSRQCEEQLRIMDIARVAETDGNRDLYCVQYVFRMPKKYAEHKWHAVGLLAVHGDGSRCACGRGVLLAEMSTTFYVVDQLPTSNKLALRDPFKANHVWEYTISRISIFKFTEAYRQPQLSYLDYRDMSLGKLKAATRLYLKSTLKIMAASRHAHN